MTRSFCAHKKKLFAFCLLIWIHASFEFFDVLVKIVTDVHNNREMDRAKASAEEEGEQMSICCKEATGTADGGLNR